MCLAWTPPIRSDALPTAESDAPGRQKRAGDAHRAGKRRTGAGGHRVACAHPEGLVIEHSGPNVRVLLARVELLVVTSECGKMMQSRSVHAVRGQLSCPCVVRNSASSTRRLDAIALYCALENGRPVLLDIGKAPVHRYDHQSATETPDTRGAGDASRALEPAVRAVRLWPHWTSIRLRLPVNGTGKGGANWFAMRRDRGSSRTETLVGSDCAKEQWYFHIGQCPCATWRWCLSTPVGCTLPQVRAPTTETTASPSFGAYPRKTATGGSQWQCRVVRSQGGPLERDQTSQLTPGVPQFTEMSRKPELAEFPR